MKVLALSLMRLGDLVMHLGALKAYKDKHDCEIHLLLNRECRGLMALVRWVDKVYYFDRELVQRSLGEKFLPMDSGFDHVDQLISQINFEKYDSVFNVTNNQISARFMDLIESPNKVGAGFVSGRPYITKGIWENILNDSPLSQGEVLFHQVDLIKGLLGARGMSPCLAENEIGQVEIFELLDDRPVIAIQPLTSDDKKNWGLERYFNLILLLSQEFSGHRILILASPAEEKELKSVFESALPANCEIACVSLSGAFSVLKKAAILISGDTLMKHLAAEAGCRTVEICIGSSRFRETGIYDSKSLIIVNRELCSPCRHSEGCIRERKYCADRIRSSDVFFLVQAILTGNDNGIIQYAKARSLDFTIYKSSFDSAGYWFADPILPEIISYCNFMAERFYIKIQDRAEADNQLQVDSKYMFQKILAQRPETLPGIIGEVERLNELKILLADFQAEQNLGRASQVNNRLLEFFNRISSLPESRLRLEELIQLRSDNDYERKNKNFSYWLNEAVNRCESKLKYFNAILSHGGLNEKGSRTTP